MSRKATLFIASLIFMIAGFAGAQDNEPEEDPFTPQIRTNQRSMGDQAFAITAGLFFPLKTYLSNDWSEAGYSTGLTDSHLGVGGTGGLGYSFYLSGNLKLGLELAGSFSKDINSNYAYTIPIFLKGAYEFHPFNRISVPIHLGLGICMTSWKDYFVADLILKPGFGVYFDWSYEWSFGIDTSYWFVPQWSPDDKEQRSIANFMDVTLTAEYHF